jgi:hypothetical protein
MKYKGQSCFRSQTEDSLVLSKDIENLLQDGALLYRGKALVKVATVLTLARCREHTTQYANKQKP